MNKSNFGTFLNIVNTVSSAPPAPQDGSASLDNTNAQSGVQASPVEILKYVNEHGGVVSTVDLMAAMNMPIATFANSLEKLRESQLVELETTPLNSVSLTKAGELIAQLPADAISSSL